jgi:hypothetical protein
VKTVLGSPATCAGPDANCAAVHVPPGFGRAWPVGAGVGDIAAATGLLEGEGSAGDVAADDGVFEATGGADDAIAWVGVPLVRPGPGGVAPQPARTVTSRRPTKCRMST